MTVDDVAQEPPRQPGNACEGVDLNRNLDLLGGGDRGRRPALPAATSSADRRRSASPRRGTSRTCSTRRIDCFVDVHSYRADPLPVGARADADRGPDALHHLGERDVRGWAGPATRSTCPHATCSAPDGRPRIVTRSARCAGASTRRDGHRPVSDDRHADLRLQPAHRQPSCARPTATRSRPGHGEAASPVPPRRSHAGQADAKSGILALAQQCIAPSSLIGFRAFRGETRSRAQLREWPRVDEWISLGASRRPLGLSSPKNGCSPRRASSSGARRSRGSTPALTDYDVERHRVERALSKQPSHWTCGET